MSGNNSDGFCSTVPDAENAESLDSKEFSNFFQGFVGELQQERFVLNFMEQQFISIRDSGEENWVRSCARLAMKLALEEPEQVIKLINKIQSDKEQQ